MKTSSTMIASISRPSTINADTTSLTITLQIPFAPSDSPSLTLLLPSFTCSACFAIPFNATHSNFIFSNLSVISSKVYMITISNFTNFYSLEPIIVAATLKTSNQLYIYAECTFTLKNNNAANLPLTYLWTSYLLGSNTQLIITIGNSIQIPYIASFTIIFNK